MNREAIHPAFRALYDRAVVSGNPNLMEQVLRLNAQGAEKAENYYSAKNLDFSRTAAAIDAYDEFNENPANFDGKNNEEVLAAFAKLEKLAESVGEAYGFDTSDRNSMDTCKACVRPGSKVPGPGCELSFVRKMVSEWKNQ